MVTPSRTLTPMIPKLLRQGLVAICVVALSLLSVVSVTAVHASEPKSQSVASTQSTPPIAPEIMFFILKGNGDGGEDTVQITDTDADGVADTGDLCANTPAGAAVNAQGCADSQIDDDGDSVTNDLDQCPSTPSDETADAVGCSPSQLDSDDDGVSDDLDQCPNTSFGVVVDDEGCEDTSGSLRDDYIQNVNPLITDSQRGCTSSGCHGRVSAPGGLVLYNSAVAGSADSNYESMVSYIDRSSVTRLMGKISGTSGHGGGVRYGTSTSAYQVIKTWAEAVEAR